MAKRRKEAEKVPLNRMRSPEPSAPAPLPSAPNDRVDIATQPCQVQVAKKVAAKVRSPTKLQRFNAWLMKVGPSWFSNAEIQKHKKLLLIIVGFCLFGSFLCSIGIALIAAPPNALYNLVFLIGGFVILVPGVYYLVFVIQAYRGVEGYDFQDLPQMN